MHDTLALASTSAERTASQRQVPLKQVQESDVWGLLVDLDGTLLVGGQAVNGAKELVEAFGDKIAVLTNNSTHTPEQIAHQLRRAGLTIKSDRIFTAGCMLIKTLNKAHPGASVFPLLSPTMQRHASSAGVRLAPASEAEVVAVGRMTSLTYQHLQEACNAASRGAKIIGANPDTSHPGGNGGVVPETGAIVAAIEAALGVVSSTHFVGKPEPDLAWIALESMSLTSASNVLVIGDNPITDGGLAHAIGARFVAVE